MEDKCPKCGNPLITRTIKKEIGLGSIDYPVAQVCQKCNWNRDLTGAGDIVSKPVTIEPVEAKIEEKTPVVAPPKMQPSPGMNRIITIALAIVVLVGLAWAFYPSPKEAAQAPPPAPTPAVTPVVTPAITATPVPDVTPTGKVIPVKLDRFRGFYNLVQGTVKIKPGDEVVFTNEGTDSITLVSADGLFAAKLLDNGKRTNYVFKKPGTYSFNIKENKLNGTIVVEP